MAILKMSLPASLFILAIVIIRALALQRLPKMTFLALWAGALCRLFIPFSVPSLFNVYTLMDMLKRHFSTMAATVTGMVTRCRRMRTLVQSFGMGNVCAGKP